MLQTKNRNIKRLLSTGRTFLNNSPSASLDSQLILSHILNCKKEFLFSHPEFKVEPSNINKYYNLLGKRSKDYPLAYLLKYKEFYGLHFKINNSVLIPRPETEDLVDNAIDIIKRTKGYTSVCDLGTGSGCIPIAIIKNINNRESIRIDALEIDNNALRMARINANDLLDENEYRLIKFLKVDYVRSSLIKNYDLIIANPPYLNQNEMNLIKNGPVRYEPIKALFGGKDGMDFYRIINKLIIKHLNPKGIAIIEMGNQDIEIYKEIFSKELSLTFKKDQNNKYRYLIISHQ